MKYRISRISRISRMTGSRETPFVVEINFSHLLPQYSILCELFTLLADDYCYWGNGKSYRGIMKTSINGTPCLQWLAHFNLPISDYPELAGQHSYCRNPGDTESQPWCYVDVNQTMQKEFCDIPKCGKFNISLINKHKKNNFKCYKKFVCSQLKTYGSMQLLVLC